MICNNEIFKPPIAKFDLLVARWFGARFDRTKKKSQRSSERVARFVLRSTNASNCELTTTCVVIRIKEWRPIHTNATRANNFVFTFLYSIVQRQPLELVKRRPLLISSVIQCSPSQREDASFTQTSASVCVRPTFCAFRAIEGITQPRGLPRGLSDSRCRDAFKHCTYPVDPVDPTRFKARELRADGGRMGMSSNSNSIVGRA